ncbi:hypothetical protein [Hypericibacter sp.]|uniref:hypothetical protein n=1 Tax=Hypericibacter sp. TaxID=2705401 RepID=UPI003D6CBF50
MARNLGGAIGIAACATILNDRTNLHFLRLADHLNATNTALTELMTRVGAIYSDAMGGDTVAGQTAAFKQLWVLTWREAQVQTFSDAVWIIFVCFVIATAMVPLMRKVAPPKAPTADAH